MLKWDAHTYHAYLYGIQTVYHRRFYNQGNCKLSLL
nr:MAG TPA_asm: hypothetical protein [Caudoviricetes sp.]